MKPLSIRHLSPLSVLLLLTLLSACGRGEPVAGTAIANVTIIDAVSGARPNQTVIFDGDRIVSVAPTKDAPAAQHIIDGSGRFLIPGLWDMHVHLTYDNRFTETMPALFIRYGITSVRDTGGLIEKLKPVVARMRAPDSIAPRVFYSGPLLDGSIVVYDGESAPDIGTANSSVEQARQNVAQLADAGVDFIKIYEMVEPDVFAALVDEATRRQLPIAAHVPLSMRASEAAPRVGSMEHLRNIELDCASNRADLLAERQALLNNNEGKSGIVLRASIHKAQRDVAIANIDEQRCNEVLATLRQTIQVPTARLNAINTFSPFEREDWQSAISELPESVHEKWKTTPSWLGNQQNESFVRLGTFTLEMIGKLKAANVPIGAGTDTPIAYALPGYSLHSELEVLVAGGLTPLEALAAATIQPAAFFSLQDDMGEIREGMRADMVLLNADPLADIRNTRTIHQVIARGRVVSTEAAPATR